MARQKKSRKLTDIMPARKTDKKVDSSKPKSGRKLTRYELDAKAREDKRKRKHKGLASGSRHSQQQQTTQHTVNKLDPRVGSRRKVPLIVEWVNDAQSTKPPVTISKQDPMQELEQLENNECLNQLLDQLETGETLNLKDQQFVDECLARIEQLMQQLGIENDEDEAQEEALLRTFNNIDINQFK